MHQGGVRVITRAMFIIATAGFLAWGFCVSAISPGDLLISKVQITGGTSKTSEDIVSIYNASSSVVDLNGLRLVKRTKTGTTDTTLKSWVSPTLINPGAVYSWANSSNGFADSIQADCSSSQTISDDNGVALREGAENSGTIIDSLAWGQATNIFVETAPFPTNHAGGEYYKRKNNTDTNNNASDFEIYPPKIITDNPVIINPGDIRINELVSDPAEGDEWIELYNTTNSSIVLTGLSIEDASGTKTDLSGTIERWFVINKPKGALNNSGDTVILKSGETIIDAMTYGDYDDGTIADNAPTAEQPYSLARRSDGESSNNDLLDFAVTSTITKGLANQISETVQEEATQVSEYDYNRDIVISELFINPKGIDAEASEQEFIELYNRGTKAAFLTGWRFEINGVVFPLPEGTSLAGKSYLLLSVKNKLPLPNEGATIKLVQPQRQTSYQSVTYKKAPEGFSYINLLAGGWQWSAKPSPGTPNISAQQPQAQFEIIGEALLNVPLRFDASDSFGADKALSYAWDFGDDQTSTLPNPEHSFIESGKFKITLSVNNEYGSSSLSKTISIPKAVADEKVVVAAKNNNKETVSSEKKENKPFSVAGTAVSLPGTHSTQYFYFLPEYGEPLYQVYNSKKLFPKLKIGDQLIISGELDERSEGPRLKTKVAADIQIIGQDEVTMPSTSLTSDLSKAPYPRLASVSGEVGSKKWPRLILSDQAGEIEIYFSSKVGFKSAEFAVGDNISVSGILSLVDNKLRLQPRNQADVQRLEAPGFSAAAETVSTTPTILFPTSVTEPVTDSPKNKLMIYGIGLAVLALGIFGYFMVKK